MVESGGKTVTGFVVRTRRILGVVRENAEIGRFAVRRGVQGTRDPESWLYRLLTACCNQLRI